MSGESTGGEIISLEITEKLKFKMNGQTYSISTSFAEDILAKHFLTFEELKELKKLQCSIREILMAKFYLKGNIVEIITNRQQSLF